MSRGRSSLEDGETLREFVRRLSEGIYITTREGRILDANPALLAILGIDDLSDPAARDVRWLWVDPSERVRETLLLETLGAVREFELELRRPDGDVRTVLDTCYQVADPESGEPRYHGILVDITQRKELERKLLESSRRDALTGCLNRRYLDEYAARYERGATAWGAVVVDIDAFKSYNDNFGHEVGDRVLREVAAFLEEQVRGEDHVVRLGGDEFLVLLTGRAAAGVEDVARRIDGATRLEVSLSSGWALRNSGEKLDRTIARADQDLIARRAARRGAAPGGVLD